MQWKYRIEAVEKLAAVEGVHGKSVARTSTFCGFVNKKGCRNTNKPSDLEVGISSDESKFCKSNFKVEHTNKVYKQRTDQLHGNFTKNSLHLLARCVLIFKNFHLLIRSMDLGPKLDKLLEVRYDPEVDEAARRNLKRREKFKVQVQSTVRKMQVKFVEEILR